MKKILALVQTGLLAFTAIAAGAETPKAGMIEETLALDCKVVEGIHDASSWRLFNAQCMRMLFSEYVEDTNAL